MQKNCTACADLCPTLPWLRVALRTIAQILKQQRKHFRQTDGGAHCANMQFLFKILTAEPVFIRITCVYQNFDVCRQVSPDKVDPRQKVTYSFQLFGEQF